MKRLLALLASLVLAGTLTACGGTKTQSSPGGSQASLEETQSRDENMDSPSATDEAEEPNDGKKSVVLVAYFSATGNTEGIGATLQTILDSDLYEIVPEEPYTDEDLDYNTDDCRANQEQTDPAARPAIDGTLENPGDYDVVFLGYPIWWGQAPKVISTFLESYDFSGKTIVPFCTSGSSGIGSSTDHLHALAPDANWLDSQRFDAGASREEIARWVEGLDISGLPSQAEQTNS